MRKSLDKKRELDRLLSGNAGPSVQEQERMLQTIISQSTETSTPAIERSPMRWIWIPAASAACALVMVLVMLGRDQAPSDNQPSFASRGGQLPPGNLQLACFSPGATPIAPSGSSSCHPGDTLAFNLNPPPEARYFSAAALGPRGILFWYFPTQSRPSLSLDATTVAQQGIVIGSEHPSGDYQLFGFFSALPLSQSELRRAIEAYQPENDSDSRLLVKRFTVVNP